MTRPTKTQIEYVIQKLNDKADEAVRMIRKTNPAQDSNWIKAQLRKGAFTVKPDQNWSAGYGIDSYIDFTDSEYITYKEASKLAEKKVEFKNQITQVREQLIFTDSSDLLKILAETKFE